MKRVINKLALHRDTVRMLTGVELGRAVGGGDGGPDVDRIKSIFYCPPPTGTCPPPPTILPCA